ncbi:TetR/AcrR family transcriptional regulator [soil metagenome]
MATKAKETGAELGATKFERRKDAIVQAAIEPLNRNGVRGMTLAEVAAKLDMVPTAVGYYFRKKEDLAAACFLNAIDRIERLLDSADPGEVQAGMRRFLTELFTFRRAVALGHESEICWFEDVRTIRDAKVDAAYVEMFRRLRRQCVAAGGGPLAANERNARAHLLLSQALWAVLWLPRFNPEDYSRMADRLCDILAGGLAARGQVWSPKALELEVEPPPSRGEMSRAAFLGAATRLINEHGYLGASVQKICAELKVTKGSFYHHHDAKDDLVVQCFERTWKILREAQAASDKVAGNGFENLASLASALVSGQVSAAAPLLRTSALSAVPGSIRPDLVAGFDRTSARIASVISDGIADGSIRPVDAQIAAQMVSGAINAASELHHFVPGITAKDAADLYVKPLFMGLYCPTRNEVSANAP